MTREYLRVTPTSAGLDPDVVSTAIASLHKLSATESDGVIARLTLFRSEQPVTFEFLAISDGTNEPVEFYYGADTNLDVLRQRLRSIYPGSFDIDRVDIDIVQKLIQPVEQRPTEYTGRLEEDWPRDPDGVDLPTDRNPPIGTDGGTVRARPSIDDVTPYGVRWRGSVDRRKDWMTSLTDFSETITPTLNHADEENPHSGRAPLAPLIDQLTDAAQPLAFQVVFQRKPDWSRQARRRSGALLAGKDTLLQKLLSIESPGRRRDSRGEPTGNRHERHRPGASRDRRRTSQTKMRDRERDQETETRLDHLRENTPKRTFTVNARLLALSTGDDDIDELETRLDTLCSVFDPIDGPYYEIEGERFRDRGLLDRTADTRARSALERFRTRSIAMRRRDRLPRPTNRADSRLDLVLNAEELANLIVVPSAEDLTVEGSRGTRAEQRSRNPLPRPTHDITCQLRRPGLELGYLLDENRDPEDEPLKIPPALLPFHVGRFAKTGAGKSIALINDALSVYEQTSGPVFLIDTKGGGLPDNYMRAHAKRFGFEDLEENVLHFDIPALLPGFAFFNIKPALANGVPRQQAIKDRVDHYVEVLKMTMGAERYEQAVVSPNLLKYLIRLMYDEEHGLDHGRYRESVDYFGQSQLEQVVDQLYAAGPPQAAPEKAPQSSSEEVTSKIHRHLTADPRTFANIMGGVSNRMDYITVDPFLRQIFDTTEPRFDIRNLLDEDVVVIFDLGDLRADAATVMAGVILTNLYDAVTEHGSVELAATPDDYVANLLIDEASSIVVSDVFNDLLEKGREFNLSVELVSQFPEQMELEGDREVYLNVLNNIGAPIVGVDLDDCRDPQSGKIDEWARDVVTRLDSYAEVSPSGTGVHVIVEGELPEGRSRSGDVEMYETSRFFTVTGAHLDVTPTTVHRRDDVIHDVHADYVQNMVDDDADDDEAAPPATDVGDVDLDDTDLLERARAAENGDRFDALWRGRTAGYDSHSEADMALCMHLAFWTGGDAVRMDSLFRQSGLMREKWDEVHYADGSTYGEKTIERAIANTSEFYDPASGDDSSDDRVTSGGTPADTGCEESDRSHAYLTEKTRLLTARVNELEATLDRKNERIDTLEADIERLEEALVAGSREPGNSQDAHTGDADEDDAEAVEMSVWDRTKRWFGSGAT